MDFGLRDWLLVIGPIFVIAVLLHGYWRMRANRNTLKMSLDKRFMSRPGENVSPDDELSMLKAELPNGGARVRTIAEQRAMGLDEDVPVLMEPVEIDRAGSDHVDSLPGEPAVSQPIRATRNETRHRQRPEYFIVLYVTALHQPFNGQNLLESLVELDMQFGEMDIFHRMEHGESVFSLVNAVEPGTFDIGQMTELETPAVSLFMRAHELDEPLRIFDEMIAVAQSLAEELGGEVKDQSRSVVTSQTIEHCREEIRDYQHRHH